MGYCTYFNLTILDEKGTEIVGDKIIEKIRENCEEANYAFGETGHPKDSCKWYSFSDDFIKFSKMFPNNILMVSGIGEESDDRWISYFMNGKRQHCPVQISYEPLDLSKITTKKFNPRTLNIKR